MLLGNSALIANRFAIDKVAGSGGMAVVYRATDRLSGQPVAVKVLKPEHQRSAARFTREAELLAKLQHPNIVSYIAHGTTASGQSYLVMEWLDGEDLGQRLAAGVLTLRESLTCLQAVAAALAVAHSQGVVHRDIKPSNLLLRAGQLARATLLDFGIARPMHPSQDVGTTQAGLGTPLYMSPEQARGDRDIGPSADVFSIGCVIYECLTGRAPFMAAHAVAVLARILSEEALPIRILRPQLPAALEGLLARMLAKDPRQRPQDAGQLLRELAELDPMTEAPGGAAPRPQPLSGRWLHSGAQWLVFVIVSEPSSCDQQALSQLVNGYGGHCQWLLDGSLIVTVADPNLPSPLDRARAAARCALALRRERGMGALALSISRAPEGSKLPGGQGVERAVALLRSRAAAPRQDLAGEILLDPVSAALLCRQFMVTTRAEVVLLDEELHDLGEPAARPPSLTVGREGELSILTSFWETAVAEAEPSLTLVTGPPGIGKTRLSLELQQRLRRSGEPLTILTSRAEPSSVAEPYGILEQLLNSAPGPDPELLRQLQQERSDAAAQTEPLRGKFFDWLRAETAKAPVLLVVDDLQWADALSLGILGQALHTLAPAPLLLLALGRSEDRRLLGGPLAAGQTHQLVLKGLSAKASERLAGQRLGRALPAAALTQIMALSGGNPLFLQELLLALNGEDVVTDSETVIVLLQSRILALPAAARRTVLTASLFGLRFSRRWLATGLGEEPASGLDAALRAAVEAELVACLGDGTPGRESEYEFSSALIRTAAYELLAVSDRQVGAEWAEQLLNSLPAVANPKS